MDIQSVINVDIDFYNKKHIIINAKQYDKNSRFVLFTCYNKNELISISRSACAAYVRYKKADNYSVFNVCEITDEGRVLVELTEQMLAAGGLCCADLIIVKRGSAILDTDTGEIAEIKNANILSSMTFYVDVSETPVENSEIESSYDFSGFNQALEQIGLDYTEVIQLARSYAKGDADGIRYGEDTDNAKYYYEQCSTLAGEVSDNTNSTSKDAESAEASKNAAATSESYAKGYMNNAYTYMNDAKTYMENAKASETNAANSESNAETYMDNAEGYKDDAYNYSIVAQRYAVGGTGTVDGEDTDNAKYYYEQCLVSEQSILTSEQNASISEQNASASESNAKISETNALTSEQNASASEVNAADSESSAADSAIAASNSETAASGYATIAQSSMDSAIGSATSAANSATEAQTYYLQTEAIVNGLNGAFLPMGTITYEKLAELKENEIVGIGYLYNISNNFTTDDTFKAGAGIEYEAGTNVYYTADGYWDCLAGATVTGVKGSAETIYRKGNVELTAENVGAISTTDIATVDEIKTYLDIS